MAAMERVALTLDVADDAAAARHRRDLAGGGLFVPAVELERDTLVRLLVRRGATSVDVDAVVVWPTPQGVGLELRGVTAEQRAALDAILAEPAGAGAGTATATATATDAESESESESDPDPDADAEADADPDADDRTVPPATRSLYARLRGLPAIEQLKIARDGELPERIALERIYGKAVWEALLRNPRITPPEVGRLARLGTLPKPLLELIASNGAWLASPEVRRALLANPRLGADAAPRILRLLAKHELKLACSQTAYPAAIRDQARRLLRGA